MTFSSHNLTPEQVKGISITGQSVTITFPEGDTYTGVVATVEANTWGTALMDDGRVALDLDCTPLYLRDEPRVGYTWMTPWGQSTTQWAKLSQVSIAPQRDRQSV